MPTAAPTSGYCSNHAPASMPMPTEYPAHSTAATADSGTNRR